MIPEAPNAYDQVPYAAYPYRLTHPDWLATVGTLFGLDPPSVDRCRVLELGCASGGNLLPMAAALPDSTFVGIDLSARQVSEGQAMIARAGLRNVEIHRASILDVDDRYGPFDYVICYGVFSWAPGPVKEKILAICMRHLAPTGIAYVNYNAYPGGHMLAMFREMMVFAARLSSEPSVKIANARALVELLVKWGPPETLAPFLTNFAARLRAHADWYVFHEFLEETNDRFYFLDFMKRAEAADLQFLGEANLPAMFAYELAPDDVRATLAEIAPTLLLREQHLDFLRNRTFRETLLCRRSIALRHQVDATAMRSFWFRGQFTRATEGPASAGATFKTAAGAEVQTRSAIGTAVLVCLDDAWPHSLPFDELAALARERAGGGATSDEDVADTAWYCVRRGLVELRVTPDRFMADPDERPRATALARAQAAAGTDVTNIRHQRVALERFERCVLLALDGRSDRSALTERLRSMINDDGTLAARVDVALTQLGRAGILMR